MRVSGFYAERRTGRIISGPYNTFNIHYADGQVFTGVFNWDHRHATDVLEELVPLFETALNLADIAFGGAGAWSVSSPDDRLLIEGAPADPNLRIVGFSGYLSNILGIDTGNSYLDGGTWYFAAAAGVNYSWDLAISISLDFSATMDGSYKSHEGDATIRKGEITINGMANKYTSQYWSDPGQLDTQKNLVTMVKYEMDKHSFNVDTTDTMIIDVKILDWYGNIWTEGDNNWVMNLELC